MTRAWGLEVDRVELAVEAVLQPPQDSPAVSGLESTLQQLALHFLGGGMNSAVAGVPSPGPGKECGALTSSSHSRLFFWLFSLADSVYPISRAAHGVEAMEKSPSVHVWRGPR